ncbi:FAD-binding oxidoreductase [Sphaerisporangium fuscum]|uniref:FAD-binding oxidoreductase n=1 Tax=Sphaerisporangium fuscum TaxID=2835868 RepID=UPI001BDC998C|nr:FAD-binding oxidoreductase [Sphaerisporangium fuscum]
MTSHDIDGASGLAADLRRAVRGRVSVPGDEGFEASRRPWAVNVDQRVRAVVEVEDAADAAALVGYAAKAGLRLAVQPNGHGATDGLDGEILVRTGRMRGVEIRPERRTARVEAGASWGEVLTASAGHGLTGLCGSSPIVSATGFTLGGGLAWFSRRHGLAANGVRSFEVVDAEGSLRTVSAGSDPELFWALRGGGGDFALVTAMEIELYPAPHLYGGRLIWPMERAAEVMAAFRATTAVAPEELSLWFTLMRFPPFPQLPEPLRGLSAVVMDVTYLGEAAEARRLLDRFDRIPGLVVDTRDEIAIPELGGVCAEPTDPSPAVQHAELLRGLDDDAAAAFLAAAGPDTIFPLAVAQIRHLGGALARPVPDAGACGHVAEPYILSLLAIAGAPEEMAAVERRMGSFREALAPWMSGARPYTFLGHSEGPEAAFPADVLARLRAAKRRYDPDGVFRANHPISS